MMQLPDISGPVNNAHWAIEGVPANQAQVPWRRCWQLLERAIDRFPQAREAWTQEGLLSDIIMEKAQLWIAWSYDRRIIEGVVITRILDKPKAAPNDRILECPLAAGVNMAEWGPSMFAMLKAWGREQGCQYIGGYGRRGWIRLFGFKEVGKTDDGLPVMIMPLWTH